MIHVTSPGFIQFRAKEVAETLGLECAIILNLFMKNKLDLLEIIDLEVNFHLDEGLVKALKGVSFSLGTNETLGVIGESGSGKSVTAQSILGILPQPPSIIRKGEILYDTGKERLNLKSQFIRTR